MERLILGDCLKELAKLENKTVDLVITDPPYLFKGIPKTDEGQKREEANAIKGSSMRYQITKTQRNYLALGTGFDPKVLDELCRVLKKINIYIWCSKEQVPDLLNYFKGKGCSFEILTWHKTNPIPATNNTFLPDTEYLIFAREKGVFLGGTYDTKHKYYITKANVEDKKKWNHPTIKPLEIIKNLVINSSERGGGRTRSVHGFWNNRRGLQGAGA